MSNNQYFLEASTSRFKKPLSELTRMTTSNHLFKEDTNRRRWKAEIKQLEGRFKVLEEEAEMMKRALIECVEESNKLITEIHQHFSTIQHCLLRSEVDKGELYSRGIRIISLLEDRRAGLLQVLSHESNPSIVNKCIRTKALG